MDPGTRPTARANGKVGKVAWPSAIRRMAASQSAVMSGRVVASGRAAMSERPTGVADRFRPRRSMNLRSKRVWMISGASGPVPHSLFGRPRAPRSSAGPAPRSGLTAHRERASSVTAPSRGRAFVVTGRRLGCGESPHGARATRAHQQSPAASRSVGWPHPGSPGVDRHGCRRRR